MGADENITDKQLKKEVGGGVNYAPLVSGLTY